MKLLANYFLALCHANNEDTAQQYRVDKLLQHITLPQTTDITSKVVFR